MRCWLSYLVIGFVMALIASCGGGTADGTGGVGGGGDTSGTGGAGDTVSPPQPPYRVDNVVVGAAGGNSEGSAGELRVVVGPTAGVSGNGSYTLHVGFVGFVVREEP